MNTLPSPTSVALPIFFAGLALLASCGEEPDPANNSTSNSAGSQRAGEEQNPSTDAGNPSGSGPAAEVKLPDGPSSQSLNWGGSFAEEGQSRGLTYLNRSGEAHKPTVLEAGGAGVAVLDLENDGDLDLVFGQGLGSLTELVAGPGADLALFHNDGQANFSESDSPGLSGWWTGLAAGDIDGDGSTDLVAAGFGDLALLLQDEAGRLVPTDSATLSPPDSGKLVPGAKREVGEIPLWATSLALFDADRDGHLDLYVGQYLDLDPLDPPLGSLGEGALAFPCSWKGHEVYCGPRGLTAQPDRLLRGLGNGQFEDVTSAWLPHVEPGFTLAVATFDADGDGDTDIYVANDSVPNRLFINDGQAKFNDYAMQAGVAVNQDGLAQAGMGIAFGDINRDGQFDLALTNFSGEPTELYYGAAIGFRPQTHRLGLGRLSSRLLSWGVHLVDFDGDTNLDLFTANGHVYPQADREFTGTEYAQNDTLWSILPGRPITPVSIRGERPINALPHVSRGSAVADFDNDGAPDLVVTTVDGPALLGINRSTPETGAGNRLSLLLLGSDKINAESTGFRTPLDAMGARIVVSPVLSDGTARNRQLAEVQTSGSYQSSSTPWVHFGLGSSEQYSSIEIRWPSGRTEAIPPGAANCALTIREGEGVIAKRNFETETQK